MVKQSSQTERHKRARIIIAGALMLVALDSSIPARALSPSQPVGASRYYTRGLHEFKMGDYSKAVFYLNRVTQQDPQNALAYYYLANSLVHLKRHPEAMAAYRRSYELDPCGNVSGFCRRALIAYHVAIPAPAKSAELEPDDEDQEEGVAEPEKSVASVDPWIDKTHRRMKGQLEEEKSRRKALSDSLSANVIKTAEEKARKIKEQAEEEIRELYAGPWLGRARGMPFEMLSPTQQAAVKQRADEIRREANERAESEKAIALERTDHYKQWASDRQQDLEKAADNLEAQMHGLPGRSGILLSPIGTGLYIRNYTTFAPKTPLPDAQASIED